MIDGPTALAARPDGAAQDDDFAPLDIKIVVAVHPIGKLMCATNDGCGQTCANGASACSSFIEDPA
ncbi:FxLD family lanthipeptide [Streptomyces paludis]|uniref:FxLD family lantipeptide n=1 Tax=Streptomyces paludis TaxID=2282738 RepID=A0A345I1H9_9ACTN|nr:FxLD family lanthipeptide [Streptomyces paludis]AXG82803.1 FxLD family lantipeptide [Streptomyces paludis]